MYSIEVKSGDEEPIAACDMSIGDIAVVVDTGYQGHYVLMTYDSVVSLSNPGHTWTKNTTMRVTPLRRGSVIMLKVK